MNHQKLISALYLASISGALIVGIMGLTSKFSDNLVIYSYTTTICLWSMTSRFYKIWVFYDNVWWNVVSNIMLIGIYTTVIGLILSLTTDCITYNVFYFIGYNITILPYLPIIFRDLCCS